jgi:hypothetical protein
MGNLTDQVDCCLKADIPAVAGIHAKVFATTDNELSEGLRSYYETVFFDNPWYDKEQPSLVYRSQEGKVEGFLGVIPRRMNFKGRSIRVAILHRLMVAPDCSSPLAAVRMIKRFLSGPQDLALGDGANDLGRKFMEGMGASISYLYSMNWICPLRPCSYMRGIFAKHKALGILTAISWPACSLLDRLIRKTPLSPSRNARLDGCSAVEMDSRLLLSCIKEFSEQVSLRPAYDIADIKWLWDFLKSNTHRGRLQGIEVRNAKGRRIGVYLYYLNSTKLAEVMLLLAHNDSIDTVFRHLLNHTLHRGAICVYGRLEPKFLQSFWVNNCFIKRGSWAVVHARDPELLNVINRGDAMLSALEGELWLRSPRDRL